MSQPSVVTARSGSLVFAIQAGVLYVGLTLFALLSGWVFFAGLYAISFALIWLVFPPIRWRKGWVLATIDDRGAQFRLGGFLPWDDVTSLRVGSMLTRSAVFGAATQSRVLAFVPADPAAGAGKFPLWERANAWHLRRRFGSRFALTESLIAEPFDDLVARVQQISGLSMEPSP
jgi:hypothetical protein